MKKIVLVLTLIYLSFLNSFSIEIPPGGTNMIDDAITNHSQVGSQGTVTVVDADQTDFDKAIRVDVTSLPENYWNFQVAFQTNMALEKDDVCLVSFWARTTQSESEAGEGILTAIMEHNETYTKPLSKTFSVGGDWVHFVYGFVANMDLPFDKIKAAFFFGHAVQTIEIADVQYLNYKKTISIEDLPMMEVRYNGMEEDASWRIEANERIEKFRKGNISVKLVDSNDNPVPNTNVTVKMKMHKFGFGTAIDGQTYISNATYRTHILELFNEVVFENDLKWNSWMWRPDHDYIMTGINHLTDNNIAVRGHCLIWPGWSTLPSFMEDLKNDPERLKLECINHIEETAGFTKGKLIDWDVINEPYTNHVLQDICGDEIMADWFKKVKEVDPGVKKYINDYSILGNGGVDVNHQNHYFQTIQYIEEQGGEIDGIGMQGHFSEFVTGIPKVLETLDRFSVFNKEIKITEFDINSLNDELKVNYTRDFMTALYSHPYVKSILCWGFWEGRHWRPDAAYYNADWSIRPNGEMYKSLVFDEWWTKEQAAVSDAQGSINLSSCFLGTYDIIVEYNGNTIVKSVPIHFNQENSITLNVEDQTIVVEGTNHADTPLLTTAKKLEDIKSGELRVYPNPASSFLNVELKGVKKENCQARILNVSGSCVYDQVINVASKNTIQIPDLTPGLYFLSLQNKDQQWVSRFIKR
ncbi:MAG: endo-1,4-beta-xylanase [Mariniphaga sp.]|nr:endo-1,4-beta-xylanase [Mariniphaga sp.]